ncbi:DNA gyrase inhibitor YacG [Aestuariibacter sp. A3R04]|uniref:DNA gyrase inhibitor YacG n=1 Tax=Aestuariibacter sp. A3R04 TaxID=2841571 RepID=UPI001C09EC13|nr:DNA gyrase inhibitor YacG [Aestuariibacter sp. A3R04]MBU3021547.1 DNA gyrase inhibitor YacG [Aestuariibacter sp. A3R04]
MIVNCPTCQADVEWSENSPNRPFCSKKCQLIDLGEWATEDRTIAGEKSASDTPENMPDIEDIEAMLSQQAGDFFKH